MQHSQWDAQNNIVRCDAMAKDVHFSGGALKGKNSKMIYFRVLPCKLSNS